LPRRQAPYTGRVTAPPANAPPATTDAATTDAGGEMTGWNVLHLFCRVPFFDRAAQGGSPYKNPWKAIHAGVLGAVDAARKEDHQVVSVAITGHKADVCFLVLGPDMSVLRRFQTAVQRAGLQVCDSYVSLTEVSEYAAQLPDEMKQARLYPVLPPQAMPAFCFYPMSKRRAPGAENWYMLGYDERLDLMQRHGLVGRRFRGRVLQLVTGSTGIDNHEWGVTLFGRNFGDLKDCVYEMRFDEGSARYADFGEFYAGTVGEPEAVLRAVGGTPPQQ
jgi:peroxiredoxin